ncbi:putative transposable element [Trichonephila clavipes]|nr:putative transposable element [Trichonephila clavipes]
MQLSFPYGCRLPVQGNADPSVVNNGKTIQPAKTKKEKKRDFLGDVSKLGQSTSLFGLAIHQNDHQARRRFVEWAQNEIAVVPDFHKRILFSDEAHFWLNGYVNKQNCRIWSEANPQVFVETPLHPEKLTVWCALWAGGIIGLYFFKSDEGHNVAVNSDRYGAGVANRFGSTCHFF